MSLELPFGIKPVNPVAVDYYSGPWSGASTQEAINAANSGIPAAVRFTGLTANLVIAGEAKKYWYASGISDSHLVNFGDTLLDGNASVSGTPSGVAFFGESGLITDNSNFVFSSGDPLLKIRVSGDATNNIEWRIGDDPDGNPEAYHILLSPNGTANITNWANIGIGGSGPIYHRYRKDITAIQSVINGNTRFSLGMSSSFIHTNLNPNSTADSRNLGQSNYVWGQVYGGKLISNIQNSTDVGVTVQGAVAQTANLTEWQDDLGGVLAYVDSGGSAMFRDLTVDNMTVSGTFTYVNSENVTIADKQIELASNSGSAIGGDSLVDQGGIVVKSTDGDKSFLWSQSSNAWTANKNLVVQGTITNPAMQTFVNNNVLFNNDVTVTNDLFVSGAISSLAQATITGLTNTTESYLKLLRDNGSQVFNFSAAGASSSRIHGDNEFNIETDTSTGTLSLGNVNGRHGVYITNEGFNVGIGKVVPAVDGVTIGRAEYPVMLNGSGTFIYNNNDVDETNYERLEIKWDANQAVVSTATSGTGSNANLIVGGPNYAAASNLFFNASNGTGSLRHGSTEIFTWSNSYVTVGRNFYPSSDSLRTNGINTRRWLNTYTDTITIGNGVDAVLTADAANTLALRNSTNAQQFNVYSTYTDASNYERLQFRATATASYIETTSAGTGVDRALFISNGSGTNRGLIIGSAVQSYTDFHPQTDSVSDLGITTKRWATTYTNTIDVEADSSTDVPAVIKGAAAQSANLTEWKNSSDEILTIVDESGSLRTYEDVYFYGSGNINDDTYGNYRRLKGSWVADNEYKFRLDGMTHDDYPALSFDVTIGSNNIRGGLALGNNGGSLKWSNNSVLSWGGSWVTFAGSTFRSNIYQYADLGTANNRLLDWGNLFLRDVAYTSGINTSGIYLHDNVPNNTAYQLYNEGGELKWNGAGITPTGTPSGVGFFGDNGVLTESTGLTYDSGNYLLNLSGSGPALELRDSANNDILFQAKDIFNGGGGTLTGARLLFYYQGSLKAYMQANPGGGMDFPFRLRVSRTGGTTPLLDVNSNGVLVESELPTQTTLTAKGAAAQSANLTEWQNSAGDILAEIDATGQMNIYNSGGGTSNYERLEFKWDSDEAKILTVASGAGTVRDIVIAAPQTRITDGNGTVNGVYITPSPAGYNNEILSRFGYLKLKSYSSINLDHSGSIKLSANADGVSIRDDLTIDSGGSQYLYNTYTDASNYERLEFKWDANVATIDSTAAGTGTARSFDISYNGSTRFRGDSAFSYMYQANGTYLAFGSDDFKPQQDSTIELGTTFSRWLNTYTNAIDVEADSSTDVPAVIKGAASQSANLTEWQVSDGTVVAMVEPDGSISSSGDISASGSLRSSRFMASDDGVITAPAFSFDSQTNMGIYRSAVNQLNITCGANYGINLSTSNLSVTSGTALSWRTGNDLNGGHSFSTQLHQEANGVIGQYSEYVLEHYTPQQYNIYNYWGGNTSNWERLETKWDNHTATIQTAAAGSGVIRSLAINGDTVELQNSGGTKFQVGTDNKSYVNLRPSSNSSFELGSRFLRWKNIFANGAYHGVISISADTTLAENNNAVLCDASSGTITVTLPASANYSGIRYHIKKTDSSSNVITISPDGSETIDGQSSYVVNNQYESITLVCDGSNWFII